MNTFRIDESEKARILGLHETATKKQYISEQDKGYGISDSHRRAADNLLRKGPKPTGAGQRYCFTKEFLTQEIANSGYETVHGHPTRFLHMIEKGDTFGKFQNKTDQDLQRLNPLCQGLEKNFQTGLIIQYTSPMPQDVDGM